MGAPQKNGSPITVFFKRQRRSFIRIVSSHRVNIFRIRSYLKYRSQSAVPETMSRESHPSEGRKSPLMVTEVDWELSRTVQGNPGQLRHSGDRKSLFRNIARSVKPEKGAVILFCLLDQCPFRIVQTECIDEHEQSQPTRESWVNPERDSIPSGRQPPEKTLRCSYPLGRLRSRQSDLRNRCDSSS